MKPIIDSLTYPGESAPRKLERAKSKRRFDGVKVAPYLFLAPFGLFFFTFLIAPLFYTAYLSLFRSAMVGGQRFVGIDNYVRAFQDGAFWSGVSNVLSFGAWTIPILIGASLLAALIIDGGVVRGAAIFRVGLFIPYAIPGVIATLLWGYLYGPNYGLFTQTFQAVGLPAPNMMSGSNITRAIANISIWQYLGYNFVIFFAALQAVPRDLSEAAAVDGAKQRQFTWYIKLPLIRSAIVTALLFAIIGTIQLFNEPYLLRPEAKDVISSNFTPNIYAYSLAFRNQQYNYAGAVAFILGALTAMLSFLFIWVTSRKKVS